MKSALGSRPSPWPWLAAGAVGVAAGVGLFTFVYAKGYSYLSDRPEVCVNCHVMQDEYDAWSVSSHRGATCNDCHIPHVFPAKFIVKGENGFRHSWAFTFEDVQVIRIRDASRGVADANCRRCHEPMAWPITAVPGEEPVSCSRCHKRVGHAF